MLESKTESTDVPQRKNTNNSQSDNHDSNLLDNNHIESEIYERKRNYYLPSDPLGLKYFEKVWYIFKYGKTPFYIHISLPVYILSTLIFSLFHTQPLTWFTLILLILIFHMIFITLQIFFSLYMANKFDAHIHRIIIWPYGYIGYGADYKQWTHFFIVEYSAAIPHLFLFIIFLFIAAILGVANWNYVYPMNVYFGQNLLNAIWVNNITIATLHICIPVYAMKTARLWVNYLYRQRTHREVAQLIILPTGFMTVILLIFGIVDARPLPLFLSLWTIYQTYLLYDANRRNLVAKLPLFQLLEDSLRHKRGRKKKSMDVGQQNRNDILTDLDNQTQNNTQHNMSLVGVTATDNDSARDSKIEQAQNRKKMSTLDEDVEYEPKDKNNIIESEPIEVVHEQIQEIEIEKDAEIIEKKDVTEAVDVIENKTEITEQMEQKEEDLLNIDRIVMDVSHSSEKHVVVDVERKEDGNVQNVEDLLNINESELDTNVMVEQSDISSPIIMIPQTTGDSAVMVSGVSVDPDYEIVDVSANQQDTSQSDHDFVDVTND